MVVTDEFGKIDFSADTIGIEIIKSLYENGFPYLDISEQGKAVLYEVDNDIEKDLTNAKPKRSKK